MERAGVEFFKKKHPKVKKTKRNTSARSARSARSALEAREARKWGSGVSPSFLASARKFFWNDTIFAIKNCKKCAAAWLPLVQHVSPLPLLILTLETNEGFPQDMIGNDVAELFLELGQQLKFRCDRPIVSITPYLWQPSYDKSMWRAQNPCRPLSCFSIKTA